jgi:membrane associated rhomboid family serine protease
MVTQRFARRGREFLPAHLPQCQSQRDWQIFLSPLKCLFHGQHLRSRYHQSPKTPSAIPPRRRMIPLKDLTPRRSFPAITLLLIVANIAVFAYQLSLSNHASDALIRTYGLVPYKIALALQGGHYTIAQAFTPLFTCMFLHGGFLHIIGNMLFLWIFGGNVEDQFGSFAYLFFYLFCGIGSGITQVLFSWGSHMPSIGASGAISGVLGAYIVFFPAGRILTLVPLFIIWWTIRLPAFIFIGLWFALQFLSGVSSLEPSAAASGGVAWWAHVGGFILGALIALPVRAKMSARRHLI